jgi:hypothetical protein
MGKRKIIIIESAIVAVAEISWFIESMGLIQTADKFIDDAFDFF